MHQSWNWDFAEQIQDQILNIIWDENGNLIPPGVDYVMEIIENIMNVAAYTVQIHFRIELE